ncbi:MAG: alpha/beta hydrolase [Bacteroidia bacterium]|nr:alpha/beta hydrolase [Bacteroidia bacterium]MDW8302056.1 alpha/beta hydrolase [Bacteroidia bacterium]
MELFTHFGNGSVLIIAFGGYRQDMRNFIPLVEQTQDAFQWLLVHLPFINPESSIQNKLTPDGLTQIIHSQLQKYRYQKVYLLGFSIGGRIAQVIFLRSPEKFNGLILINTDGLKKHFLQWATEKKWLSEQFLYQVIEQTNFWRCLIQLAYKMRFIPAKRKNFYLKHIQNTHRRKILIKIWKMYADFKPNLNQLFKYRDKVVLIWSKQDEVLPFKIGIRAAQKLNITLHSVEGGHNIIESQPIKVAGILNSVI